MREVDRPVMTPMHCAAIPFIGQTAVGERWIDTGMTLEGWNDRVYLSATAIRQAWEILGYPSVQQYDEVSGQLDEAIALAEQFKAERDEARRELQAIDALESASWTRRKQPAPKAKAAA